MFFLFAFLCLSPPLLLPLLAALVVIIVVVLVVFVVALILLYLSNGLVLLFFLLLSYSHSRPMTVKAATKINKKNARQDEVGQENRSDESGQIGIIFHQPSFSYILGAQVV